MALRSGGLITGLDTNGLIKSLVDLEKAPIKKLEQKKSGFKNQISLVGKIKSALKTLQDKAKALDTAKEFNVNKATSTDDKMFTATATGDAAPASYAVEVTNVAKAEKDRSAAFSSTDTVKEGTLSISIKGAAAIDVALMDGDTLADVAARVNDTVDGISASVINDGTNSYLSITADKTGHTIGGTPSDALVITETYTGSSGNELTMTEIQTAENAQIKIDGLTVNSESNAVKDAITGVTINVVDTTTAAETLTITSDNDAIKTKIQEFVDAYNAAVELVVKETKVTANTNRETTLAGDGTIRSIRSVMSNNANFAVASLSNATYDSLGSIGITTSATGSLKVDSKKLTEALTEGTANVTKIFTATDGVMNRMQTALKTYTAIDGVLAARTNGMNDSIKNIDKRISSLTLRVATYEQQLLKQFTALELSMSQIQDQSSYLASSLGA